jgi:cell division protein FtsQ
MARKDSPTILQEELYPPDVDPRRDETARARSNRESTREEIDDARLVDLDVNEESPFLRGQKRVSARRSTLPKKTASRLLWTLSVLAILGFGAVGAAALYHYGEHSWRFRIESSDNIDVIGMQNVTKPQIMEVMGADIGRNIFFIPLAQQKAQLEQIPWVESASVMRFVPNRLKVEIHERMPVAFARVGPRIFLIDRVGTLMELPHNHKYSFPVILGMNPGEPISTRAPRMKAYNELIRQLDSDGAHYSQDLSEVDLSDLDDLKVRVNDPAGDVLLELGSSDYLQRFKTYIAHVQEWRQQFQKLESVNLRYDNQVIVNPEIEAKSRTPAVSPAASKPAFASGVKPASLNQRMNLNDRAVPKPVFELAPETLNAKSVAAKKTAAKPKLRKAVARAAVAKPKHPARVRQRAKPAAQLAAQKTRPSTPKTPIPVFSKIGSDKTKSDRGNKPAPGAAGTPSPKPSPGVVKQANASTSN